MPPTKSELITRKHILDVLVQTLEPLNYVHALWEGGAATFNRIDRWSDLNVHVVVDDDRVAEVFSVAKQGLGALSPIELNYEVPSPTYLYYDLPSEVVAQLEPLFFVTNRKDLRAKRAAAEQWFHQTLTQLHSINENE
jgi:hypothetical protein